MKEIEKANLLATDVYEQLFDDCFYFPSPVSGIKGRQLCMPVNNFERFNSERGGLIGQHCFR